MFCSKCGKELKDDAKFCASCGTPTGKAAEETAVPAAQQPAGAQAPPPGAPPGGPFSEGPTPPGALPPAAPGQFLETPKKRISVGLLVAIGAIAIIFLAAVIIVPIVLVSGTANQDAQKRSCQANLRTVDGAIMTYTAMSSEETYPSSLEDLVAPDTRVLKSIPTCPSGNKPYEWVEGEGGSPPNISCPNNAKHTI